MNERVSARSLFMGSQTAQQRILFLARHFASGVCKRTHGREKKGKWLKKNQKKKTLQHPVFNLNLQGPSQSDATHYWWNVRICVFFSCLPKKEKNLNMSYRYTLTQYEFKCRWKKNKKLAERTCSSWCSGRRSAACLVWPGLVVASSEVRPPGQPRPSDRRDAWRPGRTSNPAIERQTQIHSASLLCLFIILMFGMGFRLLSALDFSEDVRGSETVQKLNNSAVFNPSVISSL